MPDAGGTEPPVVITIDPMLLAQADGLLAECRRLGLTLATVESCTGGLIAATLTAIPGSSAVIETGFVTYSDRAKHALVGVPEDLLSTHGAVSEPVARAMARGGLERSGADLVVAVTGIAGPGGATPTKPVGLVHLAVTARDGTMLHERTVLRGDRATIRAETVRRALNLLAQLVH